MNISSFSRQLPSCEDVIQCSKDVGIFLNPVRANVWHSTGEAVFVVSSIMLAAQLKLTSAGLSQAGSRRSSDIFLIVISVYVPTPCTFRPLIHIKKAL